MKSGLDINGDPTLTKFRLSALPADAIAEGGPDGAGVCDGGSRDSSFLKESLQKLLEQSRYQSEKAEVRTQSEACMHRGPPPRCCRL